MTDIENKLKDLRVQWTKYPEKRPMIELQARVLKMKVKEEDIKNENFAEIVKKTLL